MRFGVDAAHEARKIYEEVGAETAGKAAVAEIIERLESRRAAARAGATTAPGEGADEDEDETPVVEARTPGAEASGARAGAARDQGTEVPSPDQQQAAGPTAGTGEVEEPAGAEEAPGDAPPAGEADEQDVAEEADEGKGSDHG